MIHLTHISHREVPVGGLRMHVAEAGSGPLVLLLHGFPECWYSWRHQLTALAEAGFHAVAPDQRGYGRTGGPPQADQYSVLHLAGDVTGLADALGEDPVLVAGHDWGAIVAWQLALLRPDRMRGVAALSVPYRPRGSRPPLAVLRSRLGDSFYMCYFQQPGPADAELARDLPSTFRRVLWGGSGEAPALLPFAPPGGGFLDACPEPAALPGWLDEADIGVYTTEFATSGFTGPLNWYRNLDRNWELTAAWQHAPVTVPALYITGDQDFVVSGTGAAQAAARLAECVPQLRETVILPGCGHWTQQERPADVSQALIAFARELQ